ncbi:histidinol phosphatase, partial [Streptomyces scabiei]|nr:histidinol phosphatase [Streptomyces scabiei]
HLTWKVHGCGRAGEWGVPEERVVTTGGVEELLGWAREREVPGRVGAVDA